MLDLGHNIQDGDFVPTEVMSHHIPHFSIRILTKADFDIATKFSGSHTSPQSAG